MEKNDDEIIAVLLEISQVAERMARDAKILAMVKGMNKKDEGKDE